MTSAADSELATAADAGRRAPRERRTQEERSAATRRLLLDATVECLVQYGYAGTTTTRVAELAGVSRGAQVHHFATKDDLVIAAVRHLADRQADAALARPDLLAGSADPVGDALDLLWKAHQGPTFDAAIELWVAARTDPDLREATTAFERGLTARLVEVAVMLFGPEISALPDFEGRLLTVLEAQRGLRLVAFLHPNASPRLDVRWQRSKAMLRTLFEHAGSGQAGSGRAGSDHAGSDHARSDHAGSDHAGSDHAGSDHARSDHARSRQAGSGQADRREI